MMDLSTEWHPVPKPVKQEKQKRQSLKRSPMKKRRSNKAKAREFEPEIRRTVMERSFGICEYCKNEPITSIHHCTFRSQLRRYEGSGGLSNALGLGPKCDALVHGGTEGQKYRQIFAELAKRLANGQPGGA